MTGYIQPTITPDGQEIERDELASINAVPSVGAPA
jgi:hypothetical protein